jgi:hypothetical protein
MAKGTKTFTTVASHFVRPHEHFYTCRFLITGDFQFIDRKEWLCLIVWNANNPSSVAFFFPLRLLFQWWNKTLVSDCSSYCLQQSFFFVLQCIGPTSVFCREQWFAYGTEHFSCMLIFVQKLVLSFWIFSKNTFSFRHFYGVSFPNYTYISGAAVAQAV